MSTGVLDAVVVPSCGISPGCQPGDMSWGVQVEDLTDADVAHGFRAGDEVCLSEAYGRWSSLVYTVALRSLGNREDAEDVTQETFITAYRKLESFRGDAQLRTWLSSIAWNKSMDSRRRGRNRRFVELDEPDAPEIETREPGPEQRALVVDRERAPATREQRLLGASPAHLGVERQAVVVEEDGRGGAGVHASAAAGGGRLAHPPHDRRRAGRTLGPCTPPRSRSTSAPSRWPCAAWTHRTASRPGPSPATASGRCRAGTTSCR